MILKNLQHQIEALENLCFAEKVQHLNRLKAEHGDVIYQLYRAVIQQQATEEWRNLADIYPRHTIEELVDIQWEHISRSSGYEFEATPTDNGIQIHCTKCPLSEMAHAIDAVDWATIQYCERSQATVAAFSDEIGFSRTKTLMQGDDHCNHCYFKK